MPLAVHMLNTEIPWAEVAIPRESISTETKSFSSRKLNGTPPDLTRIVNNKVGFNVFSGVTVFT